MKSVRRQGYVDYEHLILDDSSTDKSRKLLGEVKDEHVKITISKKRLRCSGAYRSLCEKITGDIVAVLDSDDVLTKKAIRTIVKLYESNPEIDYIWTQHWRCNEFLHDKKTGVSRCPDEGKSFLDMGRKHCFSHWRTFRSRLLKKGEIFAEKLNCAVDKWMGYALEELGVGGFANTKLYIYRQRLTSLSTSHTRIKWRKMREQIAQKRKEQNIETYPIYNLEV